MRFNENKRLYGIDLDADPVIVPSGFEVIKHIKGGFLEWNPRRPQIELYLTADQRKGISGSKVLTSPLPERIRIDSPLTSTICTGK